MPADVNKDVADLIQKMVQVDVTKRIKLEEVLSHQLFHQSSMMSSSAAIISATLSGKISSTTTPVSQEEFPEALRLSVLQDLAALSKMTEPCLIKLLKKKKSLPSCSLGTLEISKDMTIREGGVEKSPFGSLSSVETDDDKKAPNTLDYYQRLYLLLLQRENKRLDFLKREFPTKLPREEKGSAGVPSLKGRPTAHSQSTIHEKLLSCKDDDDTRKVRKARSLSEVAVGLADGPPSRRHQSTKPRSLQQPSRLRVRRSRQPPPPSSPVSTPRPPPPPPFVQLPQRSKGQDCWGTPRQQEAKWKNHICSQRLFCVLL
jgi:serine/threonine protein kinase